MTDDWLKEIDNKKVVGAILLNFSAAFDIIHHFILYFLCNLYLTRQVSQEQILILQTCCRKNICVMAYQCLPYYGFRDI